MFYGQEDDEMYSYSIIEPGKVYELSYHKCTCQKVISGEINNPEQCECSKQSILYILRNIEPNATYKVDIIESVLRDSNKCRLRITVLKNKGEEYV